MNLVFATATTGQLAEIDRLIRSAFTPYVRALGREIAADAYGWFADAVGQGDIYAALDGTEIVGAMVTRWHGDDLELALIGVSPTRQKSGIASRMLVEIEPGARRAHAVAHDRRDDARPGAALRPPRLSHCSPRPARARQGRLHPRLHGEGVAPAVTGAVTGW